MPLDFFNRSNIHNSSKFAVYTANNIFLGRIYTIFVFATQFITILFRENMKGIVAEPGALALIQRIRYLNLNRL